MQNLKDILAIIIIFLIVSVVVSFGFMFLLAMIPLMIGVIIYGYVKDEKLH